ncbi:MAG: nicotinate (nicotinamide) nucleotide adenylyltransferase [Candidatus Dormiibacterota bacterium]
MPEGSSSTVFFGGTFDPPHLGHLAVIRGLREQTDLPVLVVPAGLPGHRPRPQASPEQRAEMVDLAIQGLEDALVTVSRREVEQSQPCFTVDTVEWLRSQTPDVSLVLAVGSDVAAGLPQWKQVGRLLIQVRLLVFERPAAGEPGEVVLANLRRRQLPLVGAQVITIAAPTVDAAAIRERVAQGEQCLDLLPQVVAEYVQSHGLYGADPRTGPSSGAG